MSKKYLKLIIILIIGVVTIIPVKVDAAALTTLYVKGIQEKGRAVDLTTQKSWKLTFTSPNNYMVVVAETDNPSYTIEGAGKVELEEGENNKVVTVKDENGEVVEEYKLNVTYSSKGFPASDNPDTGNLMNTIIIASVGIAALGTYYFVNNNKKFNRI